MEVMDFNTMQRNDNKPKYLKINSRDLMIPEHAQRRFVQRHGDKLAAEWTMEKFKPLDVSFRDGKYWVIDGQHRLYAMKKRKGGDCTILCYVHYGMTVHDEAEFFLNQLKNNKPILTTDRMRIRFMIGDETLWEWCGEPRKLGLPWISATTKQPAELPRWLRWKLYTRPFRMRNMSMC